MSQAKKAYARQGRGSSNGFNEKWRNSPLWDNIHTKKDKEVSEKVSNELTEIKEHQETQKETEHKTEEEILKDKQRKMFASVY